MSGIEIEVTGDMSHARVTDVRPRSGEMFPSALETFGLLLIQCEACRRLDIKYPNYPTLTLSGTFESVGSLHKACYAGRGYLLQPLHPVSETIKLGDREKRKLVKKYLFAKKGNNDQWYVVGVRDVTKLPSITVHHNGARTTDGEALSKLADRIREALDPDMQFQPRFSRAGDAWVPIDPPRPPEDGSEHPRAQARGRNPRPRVLTQAQMYDAMQASLVNVTAESPICLMSYQIGDPLDEQPAIVEWHNRLAQWLKSNPRPKTKVKRIVAFQSLWKLRWLDELVNEFGQDDRIDFNVRLFPAPFVWETRGEAAPLPMQVQIIGRDIFVGGTRAQEESIDSEFWGIHLSTSGDERPGQFFRRHHQAMWSYAKKCPRDELDSSGVDVIVQGQAKLERVRRFKEVMCRSWLVHQAKAVRSESGFRRFFRDQILDLIKHGPSDWDEALCADRANTWSIDEPYDRLVLVDFDARLDQDGKPRQMVEIMLARWQRGAASLPHDHGGAFGYVFVLRGTAESRDYYEASGRLVAGPAREYTREGGEIAVNPTLIHSTKCAGKGAPLVTLHIYCKPEPDGQQGFRVFDETGRVGHKTEGGAWDKDVVWER